MVITFPFLGAGFAHIPPAFLVSCEVQTRYSKTLKCSERYIGDHLSGTKVKIWIFSEYDAAFNLFLHYLLNPYQVIHFLLHIIFIKRIRPWVFKQSTCTLYASKISLFNVFINECKLTVEIPIHCSFFHGVWHSVNSLSVFVTDWSLSWSSIKWVCLWQKFCISLVAKYLSCYKLML